MEKEVRVSIKMDKRLLYDDDSDWKSLRGMGTTIFLYRRQELSPDMNKIREKIKR